MIGNWGWDDLQGWPCTNQDLGHNSEDVLRFEGRSVWGCSQSDWYEQSIVANKKLKEQYNATTALIGIGQKRQAFNPLTTHTHSHVFPCSVPIKDVERKGFTTIDNPFCNLLMGALVQGPTHWTTSNACVTNSGYFPFPHIVLLNILHNGVPCKSAGVSVPFWQI